MPPVFATAYMVGLLEWACIEAMQPHLDPGEQSVGTGIWVTHTAATPPGLTVTVDLRLVAVEGKRLTFDVRAHDGVEPIGEGRHERFVIDRERFVRKVDAKRAAALRGLNAARQERPCPDVGAISRATPGTPAAPPLRGRRAPGP
jgi:fluoroacetyl-CoA thioesterase